ncbi:MAG: hypothetical protein AAB227_01030 [Pseudomonadota bacterium]
MTTQAAKSTIIRKLLISAAALGVAAALPAPAFARGGHGGGHGGHYYQPRHYDYSYSHYRPYRNYDYYNYRHHRRGHISSGEGALIAAGIIGGVILIDRALDNRDRYDGRRDDDRRYDDRKRRGAFDDSYYYQRDDRSYDDRRADWRYDGRDFDDGRADDYRAAGSDRDLDGALLGDDTRGGARPAVLADAAFRECLAETRGAAGAGGMNVAMPGAPTDVERLADGSVRMTAQFRASNPRGESWTRRFVCEADDQGVRFLQVD